MEYALIMAGGIGSRFWPQSRIQKPKQFLPFLGESSLLKATIDRISSYIPHERIIVSTNADYVPLVLSQIPEIPEENVIGEPVARNTGPCIAFAAALIHHRAPDSTMIVLPSDHYIQNNEDFLSDLQTAVLAAREDHRLVTIGITPTRPETGYGYIQYLDNKALAVNNHTAYPVKTFAEKPDLQTALKFLQSGDFLWNSGMFIWKTEEILNAIKDYLPVLFHQVEIFEMDVKAANGKIPKATLDKVYQACFSISIDYGVMEKAKNVYVIPSRFGWSDLGSWMAIYEMKSHHSDSQGNILEADNTIVIQSENCLIQSQSNKVIALVGLQGIGLIETDDALLICNLKESQNVKEIYSQLSGDNDKYR